MVLANIHKNVLSQDMQVYAELLAVGGHLLLSGFFEGMFRPCNRAWRRQVCT